MTKLKKLVKLFIFLVLFLTILYSGLYIYSMLKPAINITKPNNYFLYDKDNNIINIDNNRYINIKDINKNVINATIAIEDKHFYKHIGFDYLRIVKALFINIKNGKTVQGASTITQQYAKNLFLNFDKTYKRKLEEAIITINLETHYKKSEILEGYLNSINYGGIFGIENASYYYFNKSSKDLSLAEASILAGIPKSPTNYSPITNYDNAKKRQKLILNYMMKNKMINEKDMKNAYNEKLTFYGKNDKSTSKTIMYYKDAVINELRNIKNISNKIKDLNGIKIYTNLDYKLQKNLENNFDKYFNNNSDIQYSSVASDSKTGKIKALIGGNDYNKSQFNRALNSNRQVGSTLKPFLYYTALENGFTASTTFNSTKTTFLFSNNKTYSPQNYANIYGEKEISMATALSYSDNIYAVKTHLFLGENSLVNTLNKIGIKKNIKPLPSLALGTSELSMMEMIKAYQTLASYGNKIEPYFIRKIEDLNGKTIYSYKKKEEEILNKNIVYIINELLKNCYNKKMIDYSYPTCINIEPKLTKKYAIKTGTTDTDNLIFGYNSNLILGIWSGYDNNKKTDSSTSNNIKNVWADTMESYFSNNNKDNWFEIPSNVIGVLVNPISGKLDGNNKTMLYYIKGTEPTLEDKNFDDLIPTMKEE